MFFRCCTCLLTNCDYFRTRLAKINSILANYSKNSGSFVFVYDNVKFRYRKWRTSDIRLKVRPYRTHDYLACVIKREILFNYSTCIYSFDFCIYMYMSFVFFTFSLSPQCFLPPFQISDRNIIACLL